MPILILSAWYMDVMSRLARALIRFAGTCLMEAKAEMAEVKGAQACHSTVESLYLFQ